MLHDAFWQLCLIHARPCGHLVVLFVAPQCVHLQLIQIDFGQIGVRFVAVVFRLFSTALRTSALNSTFVKVTNVYVMGLRKQTVENFALENKCHCSDHKTVKQSITCGSMLNFRRLVVTVFCIRLLYDALPAAFRHRSFSSIKQHIWSVGPRESSSPVLNPLFMMVKLPVSSMLFTITFI